MQGKCRVEKGESKERLRIEKERNSSDSVAEVVRRDEVVQIFPCTHRDQIFACIRMTC